MGGAPESGKAGDAPEHRKSTGVPLTWILRSNIAVFILPVLYLVLATAAATGVSSASGDANADAARAQVNVVVDIVERYDARSGELPATLTEVIDGSKPMLELSNLQDPWKHPLRFEKVGLAVGVRGEAQLRAPLPSLERRTLPGHGLQPRQRQVRSPARRRRPAVQRRQRLHQRRSLPRRSLLACGSHHLRRPEPLHHRPLRPQRRLSAQPGAHRHRVRRRWVAVHGRRQLRRRGLPGGDLRELRRRPGLHRRFL